MTLGAKTDRLFAAETDVRQAASEKDSRLEIDRLMDQYGSSLLRMSALYLKDADLARDAVQDTFIKAYRHMNDYRGGSGGSLVCFQSGSD